LREIESAEGIRRDIAGSQTMAACSEAFGRRRSLAAFAKRGVLASAAGMAAVVGAQAADLPTRKAAPIEFVKTCDVAGMAGFLIPGSDTCLRISGYVSGQVAGGSLAKQYSLGFVGVPGESRVTSVETGSTRDRFGFTTRSQVNFDTRQMTSFGLLRGYAEIQANQSNGFEAIPSTMLLNVAYIQWGGLTAGRVGSFFSYLGGGPGWYDFYSPDRIGGNQPNVLAYTAAFGGGYSATISFEDALGSSVNNGFNGGFDNTAYGERFPDIVAALRADQNWGSAQISGVAHNTHVIGVSGDTTDIWGYAALAGATINLPWVGNGDKIAAQAVYSRAALGYSGIPNTAWSPGDQGFNLNGNGTIYQLTDALNYDIGHWSTPAAWSAAAYFEHHFSPQFSLTPEASVAGVRYSNSPVMISANATSFLGGRIAHWDPVPHLDFQLGIVYQDTHQATPDKYVGPTAFHSNSSGVASNFAITRDF
jgi:Porin subfamily